MSSLKRKGGPGATAAAAKSTKTESESRPTKRSKATTTTKKKPETAKTGAAAAPQKDGPAVVSRLKEEEPLFPRGGGSVLSPLEQKQIQIQAKNDVLFEQASGGGASSRKRDGAAPTKKKRRASEKEGKAARQAAAAAAAHDEEAVKIESLNYKRLVRGSLVLGQVCAVNDFDIALALPNNLVGHVPLTAVSDTLTARLQAQISREDDEGGDDSDDDDDDADDDRDQDVDPSSLFALGQYLRAYVVSTVDDSVATRRHIELSLQPRLANGGLAEHDLVPGCTVMAAVASVEDHGFVMDLGLRDADVRGFLPKKQVDGSIPDERMAQPGAVLLCVVTGRGASGKVVQLSARPTDVGGTQRWPADATTIDAFLPGTVVDAVVSSVSARGLVGKVIGHLDVTADLVHSGAGPLGTDLEAAFPVGARLRARVVCTFPAAPRPKLGVSLLPHVLALTAKTVAKRGGDGEARDAAVPPPAVLPSSALVERCTVRRVEPEIGLYVDVGVDGVPGFVHISRVRDGKVDALFASSGPYQVGSAHAGRILGYHALDGLFLVSLQPSVLAQPFLHLADVPVGAVVAGVVEKLVVNETGVGGVLVRIADGIAGLVPGMHLSDVPLQHPEKKFREGLRVRARVLSVDPRRHRLRLTLKKSLVHAEAPAVSRFDQLAVGLQTPGTVVRVLRAGAVVQFYGRLRGFLPLSEMSEAYIHDPAEHFRVGQVVGVHVLQFDPDRRRLIVSCKDPRAFGLDKQRALQALRLGDVVSATVVQKTEDDVFVELHGGDGRAALPALLPVGQLTDKAPSKNQAALRRIHVGQTLSDLVVLDKNEGRRSVTLSRKPALVQAAREGRLPTGLEDAQARLGTAVAGYVRNITPTAAFVQFTGGLIALLPRSLLPAELRAQPDLGLHKFQTMRVTIHSVDLERRRLVVSALATEEKGEDKTTTTAEGTEGEGKKDDAPRAVRPVDESIVSIADLTLGRITRARITSVKETQLNVRLADNIQGRVDVSQVFDAWGDIADPKRPLRPFQPKQVLAVRVLGVHDARNHRFLPISHRSTHSVLELSAKPSDVREDGGGAATPLSYETLEVGSHHVAFVNNVGKGCLWVNLSPAVRGRIPATEASDDLSQLQDLEAHFPVGSALRVRVLAVDPARQRLDLSARTPGAAPRVTWDSLEENAVLTGKITKVTERQLVVQLSDAVAAPVHLVDLADDYDEANPLRHAKFEFVRVAVVELDRARKRVRLSTRPSRVLSSALPVRDREITRASRPAVGDVVRGFVKNVHDKGLFVTLGGDVTAMVMIRDLSDRYLKDWQSEFHVDQLVRGRVVSVAADGRIGLSLKASVVDGHARPPLAIEDLAEGQVVEGRVRQVEEYGAFIDIDGTARLSGLCHRSEMAEKPVADARKLYRAGDRVKARVLKVDAQAKKINLGLKPSYFEEDDGDDGSDTDDDEGEEGSGVELASAADDDSDDDDQVGGGGAGASLAITGTDDDGVASEDGDSDDGDVEMTAAPALSTGGVDWSGAALDEDEDDQDKDGDDEGPAKTTATAATTKKRRASQHAHEDRTAQLDAHGPQTASDYERLLLGQPDHWQLWIAYMAFQMQVGELDQARAVAERALRTIHIREEAAKLNVWIAYLNLEVAYGTAETVEAVFRRACTYNDEQAVCEKLASIYIRSGKHDKAEALFEKMAKKFGAKSPAVWENYADFLHKTAGAPERARALLKRATQALDDRHALPLLAKFAALEFHSPHGDPEQGRTLFEGLLASYPKRFDLWNQLVDLEASAYARRRAGGGGGAGSGGRPGADPAAVRDVFERGAKVKGLKPERAKKWFKRWAQWEEENGDAASREHVSARAKQWAREAEARKKKEQEAAAEE